MGSPYVHFLEELKSIDESDYGDFMRKVNEYIVELKDNKAAITTAQIEKKIDEIQTYVQYRPSWNINWTREQLNKDAEELIFLEAVGSL